MTLSAEDLVRLDALAAAVRGERYGGIGPADRLTPPLRA